MPAELNVAGLPVTWVRRKMRNIRLVVQAPHGAVRVSSPHRVSQADIKAFVSQHLPWIAEQQALLRARHPPPLRFDSGDRVACWGQPKTLLWQPAPRCRVEEESDSLRLFCPAETSAEQREALVEAHQRRQLLDTMARLIPFFESQMQLSAREWRVKRMKTRWGSCNISARRIWLNQHLARYPEPCLAYVIVHELAHLVERQHNARFWALVQEHCPDWRQWRARLRQ